MEVLQRQANGFRNFQVPLARESIVFLRSIRGKFAPIKCVEPRTIDSKGVNGGRAGTRTPDLLRVKQVESPNSLITQKIFLH